MIFVYYIFAALLVWFSYRSCRGGVEYLRFFRNELAKPRSTYEPFATVIAPCRGIDVDLEKNLAALLKQDYGDHEVIFVVDDDKDPAAALILELLNRKDAGTRSEERPEAIFSASPRLRGSKLIVAPKAVGSSQKVENLREAVLHADERSEAFVFVDSDVRVHADWLRNMVAPLETETVGAASAYRWFISKSLNLGSELRSAWNASIASALGPNTKTNFCWGGSIAIRREVFERLNLRGTWAGTLSDDFAVTRSMKAAGLDIVHVPRAISASVEDCTCREMLEFTTRQMKITRVYATPLWVMSFFGSTLFSAVMLASLGIAVLSRSNGVAVLIALVVLLLVTVFSVLKAWLRLTAIRIVLPEHATALKRQAWYQYTLLFLTPPIFLWNLIARFSLAD